MSNGMLAAGEVYASARRNRHTTTTMYSMVIALLILVGWSVVTHIHSAVEQTVKIVPMQSTMGADQGSLLVSSALSGTVDEVFVKENQSVEAGDPLFRLDSREYRIRKEKELSRLDSLTLEISAKEKQIESKRAQCKNEEMELRSQLAAEENNVSTLESERLIQIAKARQELERTRRELKRLKNLGQHGAISQSELDVAKAEYAKSVENLRIEQLPVRESQAPEIESRLRASVASAKATFQTLNAELSALESEIRTTRHELELLELKISQCIVTTMTNGVVSRCAIRNGDWINAGVQDVSVVPEGLMAESFVASRQISEVSVGNAASISFDGIDWLTNGSMVATVSAISPDLVRQEVVQGDGSTVEIDGYRIWLRLDSGSEFAKWDRVRLGMTGIVQIQTERKRLASYLMEKALGSEWFRML